MFYERALNLNSNISKMSIKHLTRFFGLLSNVYFPTQSNSIYNDSSQNFEYNSLPDVSERLLILGLTEERPLTGIEFTYFDNFTENEIIMYVIGENINFPRNSKVEIFYKDSIFVYRIQDTFIQQGIDGKPLYGVHHLVPIN